MTDITDAATRWASRSQYEATEAIAAQASANSFRSRALADWPKLRPKIMDAISAVASELATSPAGTGPFTLRVIPPQGNFPPMASVVDTINLSLECANPATTVGLSFGAGSDYLVNFGGKSYGMNTLLAGDVEAVVRRAVLNAMAPPNAVLPPWPM